MPEAPEAEIVCRQLRTLLVGKQILGGRVFHKSFATVHRRAWLPPMPRGVVERVWRHGKWIFFAVRTSHRLDIVRANMGMSGRFASVALGRLPAHTKARHVRWTIRYTDGVETRRLLYLDPRCMGRLRRLDDEQRDAATDSMFASRGAPSLNLGPDALGPVFSKSPRWRALEVLRDRLSKRRGIKRLLMEQGRVAGLGNIYAAEACWHMQVHPDYLGCDLTNVHLSRYLDAVPSMLRESIRAGGTSFGDANSYRDSHGKEGKNGSNLHVYGRDDQPCHRCSSMIIKTRSGRSTYHCPRCQRIT